MKTFSAQDSRKQRVYKRSILRIEKAGKVHAAGPESHSPCEKQKLPGLLHWRNLCLTCRTGILSRTGLATGKKQWVNSRFFCQRREPENTRDALYKCTKLNLRRVSDHVDEQLPWPFSTSHAVSIALESKQFDSNICGCMHCRLRILERCSGETKPILILDLSKTTSGFSKTASHKT